MSFKLHSMNIRIAYFILLWGLIVAVTGCSDSNENKGPLPSIPSGLVASKITSTSFTLTWNSSSSSVGIAEYEVFSNSVSIGTTSDTSFINTGLAKSTTYGMTVRTRDTKGKLSAQSAKLNVTTNGNPSIINVTSARQIIRGFGGATVFQPETPLTNYQLDKLFGSGPGQIGLSLLRIRISTTDNWRALELSNAQGAKARGAEVIATPWSPPASMKTNNNLIGGSLKTDSYAAYATYLNDFANYMAANNASLYALSIQNEPDYAVTYESCNWSASDVQTFLRDNAGAITSTKVITPESYQFKPVLLDQSLNDPTAAANIAIVGGHIYGAGLAKYTNAFTHGKEVWMTEHFTNSDTDANVWIGSKGAMGVAKEIHDCMVIADFSAYIWWYVKRFYGPLSDDTETVTKRGYVMSQFAKFIRPGYHRIDAVQNPQTDIYVSAYTGNGKVVVVAINQSNTAINQTITIQNGTVTSLTPYRTSSTENVATLTPITPTGQDFSASLPAQSITTFVSN